MGTCFKRDATTAKIDKEISNRRSVLKNEVRMLLLGAGESGKTTFTKQVKIIHLGGFSTEDRLRFREVVFEDVLYSIQNLVRASITANEVLEQNAQVAAEKLLAITYSELDEKWSGDINLVYEDPAIKKMFDRYFTFHLLDCSEYFLSNVDRILGPGYVPTLEDVLRCRAKTTGVQELKVEIDHNQFIIVDVGGQRSERKKWIHCFQDVTAVLFFVALSEYVLKLYEDEETNRMVESLKLFDEICNSKWFTEIPIILFLNKSDLFAERIQTVNITEVFPEYKGKQEFDEASQYIQHAFTQLNENPQKEIFTHITCATNTDNIRVVLEDVQSIVLNILLTKSGLI